MGLFNFSPLVGCWSKGKTPGFGPGNGGSIPSHPVAEVPCVPDNSLKGDHVQHAAGRQQHRGTSSLLYLGTVGRTRVSRTPVRLQRAHRFCRGSTEPPAQGFGKPGAGRGWQ